MTGPSKRVLELPESPTLAITAKAKAMRAEGRDIVSFGAGEPDFDTPEHIKEAAIKAIADGQTKYTAVGGIDELKDAIIEKFAKDNGVEYSREEILVSCGGKHSLFNLFQGYLNPGDEVLVPSPYWVSYPPMIELAGAKPVIIPTTGMNGFKLVAANIDEYVTDKTKALIINSPSNPTGAAYTEDELLALATSAIDNNLLIISDEIYERIIYDAFKFKSVASLGGEIKSRCVIVNGVSKTYSMTGWRIGYTAGPAELIKAMGKIQSQSTSNPASISQWAAVAALTGDQNPVDKMLVEFAKRRAFMIDGLNGMDGVHCTLPEGAFYAFPDLSAHYGKKSPDKVINGSADLADYLLDTVGVAVVPGIAFGDDSHIRLSYACSMENIEAGLSSIADALAVLS